MFNSIFRRKYLHLGQVIRHANSWSKSRQFCSSENNNNGNNNSNDAYELNQQQTAYLQTLQQILHWRKQAIQNRILDFGLNFVLEQYKFWFSQPAIKEIQTKVEKQFRVDEFLEGTKDAYQYVVSNFNDCDWTELEGVVSRKVLNQMRQSQESLDKLNFKCRIDIERPFSSYFASIFPFRVFEVLEREETYANWLLVLVEIRYNYTYNILLNEKVIFSHKEDWWDLCILGRGPLPENIPVETLDCQWDIIEVLQFPGEMYYEEIEGNQ